MEYLRKSESVGVFGRRIISPEKQEQIASLHGLARIETMKRVAAHSRPMRYASLHGLARIETCC